MFSPLQPRAYISIISLQSVSTTQCCSSHQESAQSRKKPTGSLLFLQKTSQTKSGSLPCHLCFLLLTAGWYPKDEEGRRTVAHIKKKNKIINSQMSHRKHLPSESGKVTLQGTLSGTTGNYLIKLCFLSSTETNLSAISHG